MVAPNPGQRAHSQPRDGDLPHPKRRRLDRIKGLLEEHRNVLGVGVEDTQLACRLRR